MDKRAVEQHLLEVGFTLTQAALAKLAHSPKGEPIVACAAAMNEHGLGMLIAIPDPEHRIEALTKHAQMFGTVGFVLVYDGFIEEACLRCQGAGCEHCRTFLPPTDAIVSIVRTAWGYKHTESTCYGYLPDGTFVLKPQLNREMTPAEERTGLDGYEVVFGSEKRPS